MSLRRSIRTYLIDPIQRYVDDRTLRRIIESGSLPFDEIRRAWGNEAYSADVDYLAEVAARVAGCSGPILECGSGVSTLVAAIAAGDRTVWSLEQDAGWFDLVSRRLARIGIRNVRITHAPLKDYGGFVWYDIANLPDAFDLVLCDGPAVFECWEPSIEAQWRVGLLPVMKAMGISVRAILLDDASSDSRAPNLIERWTDLGFTHRMIGSERDMAIFEVRR
jgi:hypothetical protein